jgi:uncharacterized protein YndB with AHSA1/START domain
MPDFEKNVTVTRRIAAPAPRLWALWTTPALMRAWWGAAEGGELVECVTEARPGGALRYAMRHRMTGRVERVAGRFDRVEPPARLDFSWIWQDAAEQVATQVRITFTAEAAATRVTVEHSDQPSARVAEIHRAGWANMLADLERAAAEP